MLVQWERIVNNQNTDFNEGGLVGLNSIECQVDSFICPLSSFLESVQGCVVVKELLI